MYLEHVSIWVFFRASITENANLTKSSENQPFGIGPFIAALLYVNVAEILFPVHEYILMCCVQQNIHEYATVVYCDILIVVFTCPPFTVHRPGIISLLRLIY